MWCRFALAFFLPSGGSTNKTAKRLAASFLVGHAGLFLLAILVAGHPYDEYDPIFNIVSFLNFVFVQPLLTLCLAARFPLQAAVPQGESSVLSKQALLFKGVVDMVLAFCWPFRLILPENMWESPREELALLTLWYPYVGWACVNAAVSGIVSLGLLWYMEESGQPDEVSETSPLLQT